MSAYTITVPGRAYPHPRVTHMQIRRAIGRRDRGEELTGIDLAIVRYLNYREAVRVTTLAARIPPLHGPAEFKAVFVFRNKQHADRVNLCKAAEDGVAAAGIVQNDKQFLRDGGSEIVYGEPERTEITVREIEARRVGA